MDSKNNNTLTLYLTIGYPNIKKFMEYVDMFNDLGVDYLELGVPVENPYMDGTVIYETHRNVISKGFTEEVLVKILNEININYPNFKVILMTYEEGINKYNLLSNDKKYDAILCADKFIKIDGRNQIQIYNENLTDEDILERLNYNDEFAYVMSGVGKTGEFEGLSDKYVETIKRIRKYSNIKVQVGFGIENKQQIEKVINNGADGVIIGSKIIKIINDECNDRVREYIQMISNFK